MTLDRLDTVMAFAAVMLGVSLNITVLTQAISTLLGHRGMYLKEGLVDLLGHLDAQLKQGFVTTQKDAFRHPYGNFSVDSALAYYVFSLRNLATYPHSIRIAALNLGPKVLELGWMEELAEALDDGEVKGVFASQFVENRSHINMGRRIVEEFVQKPVDTELCRWACNVAKRDYNRFLGELSAFVLGQEAPVPPAPRRQVTD